MSGLLRNFLKSFCKKEEEKEKSDEDEKLQFRESPVISEKRSFEEQSKTGKNKIECGSKNLFKRRNVKTFSHL